MVPSYQIFQLSLYLATVFGATIPPSAPTTHLHNEELLQSPCPQYVQYAPRDKLGEWEATLVATTPHQLHGVWIKLLFDSEVKDITVGNGYEAIAAEDRKEFLIKNKNVLLGGDRREILKIAVKYDGDKVPNLMEYRLNAVTVCPDPRISRKDFYLNDLEYSKLKFTEFLETITSKKLPQPEPQYQCGTTSTTTNNYPWQAALYIKTNENQKYICEATLISTRYLITPAHCITFFKSKLRVLPEQLTLYFGKLSVADEKLGQKANISKVLLYPGYEAINFVNDLALLQLEVPISVSDKTRPICLPKTSSETNEVQSLVGYGLKDGVFNELKSVEVKRVDSCEKLVESSGVKGLERFVLDNNYCVSYNKEDDVCVGDSGSAVISSKPGQFELKGFVSVGTGIYQQKCSISTPVIVTDVFKYIQWINKFIF